MKVLLLGLCILLVSSCSAPILNIVDKPIVGVAPLSLEQTFKAIVLATSRLGWELEEVEPGLALATLHIRGNMAKVQIAYTLQNYSITYKNSSQLNYDGENIDNDYNRWIRNLDKYIKHYLSKESKISLVKDTPVIVSYDIAFDYDILESEDAMDNRFRKEIPTLCFPSTHSYADVILLISCIIGGVANSIAWSLDKILYHGDTKEWRPCLEKLSTSLRGLNGLAAVKQPLHAFLNSHKLIPVVEENPSGAVYLSQEAAFSQVQAPKLRLEFILKGPEIKNIGGDGLVTFRAEGILRKIHQDRRLRTWRKISHQSLATLCKGQNENLIEKQINGLIESLLKRMGINLPYLLMRETLLQSTM